MYIGRLLEDIIRPKTGNVEYSVDSDTGATVEGISDNLILSFINDALQFIQSRIIAVYPGEFVTENVQNTVVGQEEYSITDNIFLKNKFISVEFSDDGDLENYDPLPPAGLHQRNTSSGTPYQYIRRNGKILLNPIPKDASGKLRVNFYRALDKLNIRRGTIASIGVQTDPLFTDIALISNDYYDQYDIDNAQYICIVNKYGEVLDYNVPIVSFDSTNKAITIATQTLVGTTNDYIVTGKYQSTHLASGTPERILDYCKVFAQARIHNTDSSSDEINERIEVATVLNDIVDQFSEMTEDIQDVPIIDDLLRS